MRNIGTRPYDLPSTEINPANIPVPEYLQNVNYAQQLRQQQIQSLASQIQQLQPPAEEVPQPPAEEVPQPPQPEEIPPPEPEEMPRATYEGSERYQPASVQAEEPTPSPEAEDLTRMMQGLSMQPQPQEADIQSQITEYYGRYQEIADRVESGESIRKFNRQIGKLLNDIMSFYSYLEIPVPPKRGKQTGFSYISTLLESLGSSP
jgi:hypothetical protein